jgi:hypothetical protein
VLPLALLQAVEDRVGVPLVLLLPLEDALTLPEPEAQAVVEAEGQEEAEAEEQGEAVREEDTLREPEGVGVTWGEAQEKQRARSNAARRRTPWQGAIVGDGRAPARNGCGSGGSAREGLGFRRMPM